MQICNYCGGSIGPDGSKFEAYISNGAAFCDAKCAADAEIERLKAEVEKLRAERRDAQELADNAKAELSGRPMARCSNVGCESATDDSEYWTCQSCGIKLAAFRAQVKTALEKLRDDFCEYDCFELLRDRFDATVDALFPTEGGK